MDGRSRRRARTARRGARIVLALALLAGAGLTGCDDDSTTVVSDPITGTWVAPAQDGALFVVITDTHLTYYTAADADDCVDRTLYELEALGGNEYLLRSTVNTATVEATIIAEGDELTWETGLGSAVFQRSVAEPGAMAVCAGGGDDPALACASLPPIEAGQEVAGELTAGDDRERGRYYDVYGFQPEMPLTGDVTLRSDDFDAYLYVYDAAGTLQAENDDATTASFDAALSLQFVPACYRIEVTSLDTDETGQYTLRID